MHKDDTFVYSLINQNTQYKHQPTRTRTDLGETPVVDAGDDDRAVPSDAEAEALALPLAEANDARRRPEVARVEDGDRAERGEQVLHLVPRQVRDGQGELQCKQRGVHWVKKGSRIGLDCARPDSGAWSTLSTLLLLIQTHFRSYIVRTPT